MKKILIVDDVELNLLITQNMLQSQYITFCALSGREAMEIYHREHPDMILSDLRMPGMSGYELQQALQAESEEIIPFMFMTADQDEETEAKGFDNGAMDFIRKPFRPDVLLRRVANILQTVSRIHGLKEHASTDALTGLLNKAAAEEKLKEECRKSAGALLMIDLDSFKLVNDLHGHSMGDKILISFAKIIRATMRPNDVVGRMGGDEFVAFCQGLQDEAIIAQKTDYINTHLLEEARELMGEDMNIPLGASIGCVFIPGEGTEFSELFKKADKALYAVKQNGKHGYSVYSSEDSAASETTAESDITGLSSIEMILGERNQKDGAFNLPFESFRAVYRFLKRTRDVYDRSTCLLLFTLTQENSVNSPPEETCDEFLEALRSVLRKGDAVTKNGKNQFIALLSGLETADAPPVIERIKNSWRKRRTSKGTAIHAESALLGS